MINEHQGGEVCRSPTSPPSKDSLRIGPGRAPPRILRGTRPGCSAAAAAASEHKWSARARRPPALRLPPSGPAPLFAAPLPPARRRSGAAPAACGGTSGPRRSPSRPAWLGLSAPALARRSGGSRPPSAALRVGLRPGPARAQLARRCAAGRPWAAPGSLRSPSAPLRAPLRPVSGSLRPGPPLRRPCGGCAAAAPPLALRGSAAGPLAGLRPAFSGPRPRGWGGWVAAAAAWLPCGSWAAPPLVYKASLRSRPAKAGPAYMRTATLSHLLTHRACPPRHTAK